MRTGRCSNSHDMRSKVTIRTKCYKIFQEGVPTSSRGFQEAIKEGLPLASAYLCQGSYQVLLTGRRLPSLEF